AHMAIPADVADPAACRALVGATAARFGRVDMLVNNAGVGLAGPVAALAPADLERALAVDLFGPLHLIQAALPHMAGRGQIINLSTVLAAQTLPYLGGYAAAKAALERLSEALRMELRGSGVAVTVVRPGTTRTGFTANRLGSGRELRRLAPRGVSPEAVARAILRAARREPRLVYVTFGDRLGVWLSRLMPGVVERALSRAIRWEGPPPAAS
ncbi:MAG: SDR family NAD(P)-dependent oxidoreductase, partial [Chloroflexales bacterium]|nr:SDR family NAD(P)-dependent oxidoreductase [Chloroflexales bacterium]